VVPELVIARQHRLTLLADRAARQAAILWRKQMGADFDQGWAQIGPTLSQITATAQVTAASGASAYLTATARADGIDDTGYSAVRPSAWAGVDGSGRTLEGLLYGSVTTSKTIIGRGAGVQSALQAGQVYLQTMVRTATLDTARSSGLTAATSHRYTHYVRAISAGACSRCAMLAGIAVSRTPFQRHPGCRCTSEPVTGTDQIPARFTSPTAYFDSMPAAEQDRIFTKAGAEAIRAGADPVAVVSARRGATKAYTTEDAGVKRLAQLQRSIIGRNADGTAILGYTTGEGSTARGAFGKQNTLVTGGTGRQIRLMPETIIGLTDDVELRRVLLRDAGYLDVPTTAAERSAPRGGGFALRRAEALRADRVTADAFYKRHGIELRG
jgi:hypothetical protein